MKNVQEIVEELDRATAQLPIDQLLSELQIVVERVSFSQLEAKQTTQSNEVSIAHINMLFEDEISIEMLGYVQWLREHRLLTAVSGNNGILFLNYCIKKYKQLTQVRFITAINMSEDLKVHIRRAMASRYPAGARFIFETNSALVAGFVVEDGVTTVDRSLKRMMTTSLRPYIEKTVLGAHYG